MKTTSDLQDALKDLLGCTIQSMLEAELDEQIDEREEADPTYSDSRNGYKPKTLRSSMGEIPMVRNTLNYVASKDKKAFASDLKTIYHAPDEQTARRQLEVVREKWEQKYPGSMKRWIDNWDAVSPMFKFSQMVREMMYTTNTIDSLNSCYRRLNRDRSIFPNDTALEKAIWLATWEMTKKWTMPVKNRGRSMHS